MAIDSDWLSKKVTTLAVQPVRFGAQLFLLDGRGVLYCPGRDALVVSDLHLEKGSYLGRFANPVPQFDSLSTLIRLQGILDDYRPSQVICLGDSFHDEKGYERMADRERQLLTSLIACCNEWTWVLGNHDPAIPIQAGGKQCQSVIWGDIVLQHEAPDYRKADGIFHIIGHYHPKARLSVARRRYAGKCFVHDNVQFIMPAFGQYTGGLSIDSDVLGTLLNRAARQCFLLFESKVYRVQ